MSERVLSGEVLPPAPDVVMRVTVREMLGRDHFRPEVAEMIKMINAKDVTPK